MDEVLHGGVANVGAVVRSGDHVLRPSNPFTPSIHRALIALRDAGFEGASRPIGVDADGRERLEFLAGDVATPPYPAWAQSDELLASIARLMRGMHDASLAVELEDGSWSAEMADPHGGPVFCHNDVCLENVVARDGQAVGLIDFDFAAPGRRTFDVASFTRMCVPVDDDVNATRLGWADANRPARLRIALDAYGLEADERAEVLALLDRSIAEGGEFVRRRAEAGEPGFVTMWREMGGRERYDRRRRWWIAARPDFQRALNAS